MNTFEVTYPIGYVSRLTGLSAHLIRAWERRYGVVAPQRSESNRRLYSQADVERLQLLSGLISEGHRISHIAPLDSAGLVRLRHRSVGNAGAGAAESQTAGGQYSVAQALKAAMTAVERMNGPALEAELRSAAVGLTRLKMLEHFVSPMLEQIGRKWSAGSLRIAQEHAATAAVEGYLMGMLAGAHPPGGAPAMVVATPPGQRCTLGGLMAAVVAADRGWRVHYLGAELPTVEFAAAAQGVGAAAVTLSIVLAVGRVEVLRQLEELRAAVGGLTAIHVGGAGAFDCRRSITAMGMHFHNRLEDFAEACRYSHLKG